MKSACRATEVVKPRTAVLLINWRRSECGNMAWAGLNDSYRLIRQHIKAYTSSRNFGSSCVEVRGLVGEDTPPRINTRSGLLCNARLRRCFDKAECITQSSILRTSY